MGFCYCCDRVLSLIHSTTRETEKHWNRAAAEYESLDPPCVYMCDVYVCVLYVKVLCANLFLSISRV